MYGVGKGDGNENLIAKTRVGKSILTDGGDVESVDLGGDVEVGNVEIATGDDDFVVTVGAEGELIDGGGGRKSDGGGGEKGDEAAADLFHGVSCMLINGI